MRRLNLDEGVICQACAITLRKFVYAHTMCRSCYYQKIMKTEAIMNAFTKRIKTLVISQSFYMMQNKKLKKALGKVRVQEILGGGR